MFKVDDKKFLYVSLAFLAVMCVLPFLGYVHRRPLASFYNEWLAFALGLAALLPLLRLAIWQGTAVPVIALFPLALIVWLIVQWSFGHGGPMGPIPAMLYLLWFAALIVLGAALRRRVGLTTTVTVIAWALLIGGEANTFVGLVQHYRWNTPLNDWIIIKRDATIYGNLAQHNQYADYLMLGMVSGIYLYARGCLRGWVLAIAAAPLLFAMGLSGSRTAWLYMTALPLLALILMWRRGVTEDKRWLKAVALMLIGFVFAQWLATTAWFAPPPQENGLPQVSTAVGRVLGTAEANNNGEANTVIREELWRQSWHSFLRAPWFGVGMGGFTRMFYQFQASPAADELVVNVTYNHAHNALLQWLVEAGIVGGVLVVGAFVFWLRGVWRAPAGIEDRWLFGVVAVLILHSMVEFPLWYSYFLGILGIVFGLGATRFLATDTYAWLPRAWRVAATVAVLIGLFELFMVLSDYRAFESWRFPPEELTKEEITQHQAAWQTQTLSALGRDAMLTPYIEAALASDIEISADHIEQKLAFNARVMRFMQASGIAYRQALLLAEHGDADAALDQLAKAMHAYPRELSSMMNPLHVLANDEPAKFAPLLKLAEIQFAEQPTHSSTAREIVGSAPQVRHE